MYSNLRGYRVTVGGCIVSLGGIGYSREVCGNIRGYKVIVGRSMVIVWWHNVTVGVEGNSRWMCSNSMVEGNSRWM